jgi:hypothetical protein
MIPFTVWFRAYFCLATMTLRNKGRTEHDLAQAEGTKR